MKRISVLFSVVLFISTLSFCQSGQSTNKDLSEMTFKVTSHDFGKLKKGSDCTFEFVFKNTGKSDILITNVSASCGCTTPEYSKEPVKKNLEGKIKVRYDSNRIGQFTKTVTILSNAKNSPIILTITGTIEDTNTAVGGNQTK
jgi:hypothetical protein